MVDMPLNPTDPNYIYSIYMYKEDFVLNDLQALICHKIQTNKTKQNKTKVTVLFLIRIDDIC